MQVVEAGKRGLRKSQKSKQRSEGVPKVMKLEVEIRILTPLSIYFFVR